MKYLKVLLIVIPAILSIKAFPQQEAGNFDSKMQWFADAKLGIFIHWGIYSTGNTTESWAFHNKEISYRDYINQIKSFTAKNYDPEYWAELIRKSGARYSVITSKHHDGVALWDTKMNDLSLINKSPARRDVLSPFVNALRNEGIKVGLYYSLLDWSYPDYPGFLSDSGRYDAKKDTLRWARFLKFCHGQIKELSGKFNPDLFWFDGDWEHSAAEWKADQIRKMILQNNPHAIINGRLQGYGDYDTPEQNFPVARPNLRYWELCMTMNGSWGYKKDDNNYKTPYEIITIFADVISMGGNLLLDIGPREDGTIPEEQVNILTELGKWTGKNSEAIFGTRAGIEPGHFYGPSTLSPDSTKLYLFIPGKTAGDIVIKGLDNKIKAATVLGNGAGLLPKIVGKISWSSIPGLVYINVPEIVRDTYMTVIRLDLDKPVRLVRARAETGGNHLKTGRSDTIRKVMNAMVAMQRRAWEQGVASQALLELGEKDLMILLARDAVVNQLKDGRLGLNEGDRPVADPASNGEPVLAAWKLTGDNSFKVAADRMLDFLMYKAPRTRNGILYHNYIENMIWVDAFYMAPPFLAAAGHPDEAVRQIRGFRSILFNDEKNLYYHMWDEDRRKFERKLFWGVGNGWAAAGMTRVLRLLPDSMNAEKKEIAGYIKELLDGSLKYQREDGLFNDILDDPSSFVETNAAQMFAYAIFRGIKGGWLDDSYLKYGVEMREAARNKVDSSGLVQGVCGAPHFNSPGTATEGQAFFLLMEAAYRDLYK